MAGNKEEIEALTLLLNVEKEASILIDDAKKLSDKKVSEAKNTANSNFQTKYNELIKEMEADYNLKAETIKNNHIKEINDYKSSLETKNQNKEAFFSFVDSIFFPSEKNR